MGYPPETMVSVAAIALVRARASLRLTMLAPYV